MDWDLPEEEAKEADKAFLDGKKEPCMDEEGVTWAEDREHLLPECAKFFGFKEIDVD